jgi:Spy/CpxP family protein refolding chaperone
MALRAARSLALAAGVIFLGSIARGQTPRAQPKGQAIDYARLPSLEEGLGRDVDHTLERLNLKHHQWETVEKILEYEAAQLQMNRGDYNFSVADRLLREQQIRYHARQQIVAILTGEQRTHLTELMLRRMARAENRLDDY